VGVEKEPIGASEVYLENNKMSIDVGGGATVWCKIKLKMRIFLFNIPESDYGGGENDHLSDLNQFWMAEDPLRSDRFTRSGSFREYDSLRMYYAGIGGNRNTATRFRKYPGNGDRELIFDFSAD
jgi:hypothetical protein